MTNLFEIGFIIVLLIYKEKENEKDISAQQDKTKKNPWFQKEDVHQDRKGCVGQEKSQGEEEAYCQHWFKIWFGLKKTIPPISF